MDICVFAGTFNPIHNAHIKMAEIALNKNDFDKIIFIPSYIPPHKDVEKDLAIHRMNMVKLATKYNPKFEVSDFEYKNENKSYSIFTVKEIIKKYDIKEKLNFIIGTDAFLKIDTWYQKDELKKLVHFLVFKRTGDDITKLDDLEREQWDFEIIEYDYMNISSTEIRKTSIITDVPKEIEEYIKNNGLYEYRKL
ncbi:nicotinate (nicotinamide) nucleotide adenylyltransferase [bacterium]|nr:nicotinate (nicotinamide) nucleotide adenylyltransferase [bacterium]